MESRQYRENKTTELFHKLDKLVFFCSGLNFWVDDNGIPELVLNAYKKIAKVLNAAVVLFLVAEITSFFTQYNLTEKQKSDRVLMTFSHIVLYSLTLSLISHRKTVTEVLFALAVGLKKDFNDDETERHMLGRIRFYACAFVCLTGNSLVFYGIGGLIQVIFSDENFVTMITVWPDVNDSTPLASFGRVVIYVLWWLWLIRVTTSYLLVLTVTISLSHQYTNLQMYFKSLANIFEERLSQNEKEEKFERGLKLGIRLHATTIWCTQQVQRTCGNVFSGHIIVNIFVLVLLMTQLKNTLIPFIRVPGGRGTRARGAWSRPPVLVRGAGLAQNTDRTLENVLPTAATIMGLLFSTGLIMWNAGDITVEAENLPTAIFLSGWHNCTNMSSYRIRRLVLIAMIQSQKPVIIKSCGFIGLSYESYLTIVKTSYSIFSVMY